MSVSLDPLPTATYLALPDRERNLQAIGDVIAYWIKWVSTNGLQSEPLPLHPDTYIILGYEGAPPHWPSVGQLTKWLEVIRAGADGSQDSMFGLPSLNENLRR
jgi:hypothetical protein